MRKPNFTYPIGLSLALLILLTLGFTEIPTQDNKVITDNGVVQCKVNGVDWISGPPGHPDLGFEEEAITDGKTLVRIEAFAANGSFLAITVYRADGIGPGTYAITEAGMQGFFQDDFQAGGGYLTNGMKDNPGSVTITTMTEDKVVGIFAFAIRSAGNPDDIRQITEGRFDLKFTKY